MNAADVARVAFAELLDAVAERTFDSLKHAGPEALVRAAVEDLLGALRGDIERVIIKLRFELMEVQTNALELQQLVAQHEARAAFARGKATAEGMTIEVVKLCARCDHGQDMHGSDPDRAHKTACTGIVNEGTFAALDCECPGFVQREDGR